MISQLRTFSTYHISKLGKRGVCFTCIRCKACTPIRLLVIRRALLTRLRHLFIRQRRCDQFFSAILGVGYSLAIHNKGTSYFLITIQSPSEAEQYPPQTLWPPLSPAPAFLFHRLPAARAAVRPSSGFGSSLQKPICLKSLCSLIGPPPGICT